MAIETRARCDFAAGALGRQRACPDAHLFRFAEPPARCSLNIGYLTHGEGKFRNWVRLQSSPSAKFREANAVTTAVSVRRILRPSEASVNPDLPADSAHGDSCRYRV